MTVIQFAELIVQMLGQQHDKVEERVVLALADSIRGGMLGEMLKYSGSLGGEYVRRFSATVQEEDGQQYIDLPCDICTIPNNGAFQFIGPEDEETNFIPLRHTTVATINNMEIGALAGRTGFWQEGRKVYFRFLPVPVPPLRLKLVPSLVWLFENAPDEELMASADLETLLIEKCYAALKPKEQAPDDINDYE